MSLFVLHRLKHRSHHQGHHPPSFCACESRSCHSQRRIVGPASAAKFNSEQSLNGMRLGAERNNYCCPTDQSQSTYTSVEPLASTDTAIFPQMKFGGLPTLFKLSKLSISLCQAPCTLPTVSTSIQAQQSLSQSKSLRVISNSLWALRRLKNRSRPLSRLKMSSM